jgi:hypothetical protein
MSDVTIPVPAKVLDDIVNFIKISSELCDEASTIKSAEAAQKSAVAAKLPDVVDKLIKAGILANEQRAQALSKFHEPTKVLESLSKVAEAWRPAVKAAEKVESMGKPHEEVKVASASAETKRKESDMIWEKAFGA